MVDLSPSEARALALAAQGFHRPRPARVDARALRTTARRLGYVQIDSVNVLARAHYLTLFSRLGAYRLSALDDLAYRRRALFEYWGRQASLIPVEAYPLFRWRMERMASPRSYGAFAVWARENGRTVEAVYREVRDRGPLGAGDLAEPGERRGPWWGWSEGKSALEWLFYVGRVSVASRRNFARLYDLTERVIPAEVLARPSPAPEDAQRALVLAAARAMGVATAADLARYFVLRVATARARARELVEEGALAPARVDGWREPAFLDPSARAASPDGRGAILNPFDPLVADRARAERLFGFRYRIEIYTPAADRVHGYYVLPFLLGDALVARVDLKADRKAGTLQVRAAHLEPGAVARAAAPPIAEELRRVAAWLDLGRVEVPGRGDLAGPLRRALRPGGPSRPSPRGRGPRAS